MKIQKLTIHNIASIEDAVIDFEASPLVDSEVFLITGKTGAGKTTILDAICLALYSDAPRLDGTQMQGGTKDGEENITIKDPRQLMRKNTGQASVSLTFTGSNGIHYMATWSVARAYKKPNGNLQPKDWVLENLDDPKAKPLKKDVEIKAEIKNAIGLEFDQFCRTTLLAQGEFTRFLNSKDEEKAKILEKITGVDIYSKIGKKIYETTSKKEKIWNSAQLLVEGTETLKDWEILQKQEEIKNLNTHYESYRQLYEKDKEKLLWIKTDNENSKGLELATKTYECTVAMAESNESKAKETLVRQWNETIEARNWLAAKKSAEKNHTLLHNTLATLESDFIVVLNGFAFAEQKKQKTESESKAVSDLIESEKEKAHVYENAQTIIGHLKAIEEGRRKIAENRAIISQESKTLAMVLKPAFEKARNDATDAQQAFGRQEADVREQEELLASLHLNDLRVQHDKAKELMQNITSTYERIDSYVREKERRAQTSKALYETQVEMEKKRKQSIEMEPLIHEAKVKMEACKEMLDKQSDTIDKFAQTLRHKLKVGDFCPVCRQEIKSSIPHEDELAKLVEGLKEAYTGAESAYNELTNKKNRLDAEIQATTRSYQTTKEAYDKDRSVETAAQKVIAACKACGIETMDETTPKALESLKTKTNSDLKELEAKISEGEKKDRAIKEQRKKLDQQRQSLEQLKIEVQKAQQAIHECKGKIAIAEGVVNTKNDEIAKAEKDVSSYITGQWTTDWKVASEAFSFELKKQADDYRQMVVHKQTLDNQLSEMAKISKMTQDVIDEILQLMPEWKKLTSSTIEKMPDILKKANDVKSKTSTALVQLRQAEDDISLNTQQLEEFLKSHIDISLVRIDALQNYTSQSIKEMSSSLDEIQKKVLATKTLKEEAARKQDEHRQAKPEIKEDETIEAIDARIKDNEKKMIELAEKKGAINQELKADEENKKHLGQLIADADKKNTDYLKWSRMNEIIGDATGSKFRKIAQSYVLSSLIHSANNYMKTLTGRYTLHVTPGTFVISIEDAYQSFARRAASTISGGESFLVSLSLALALSDIGQQLAVNTLFIDEGFGTLSGEPLQNAINTLRSLQTKTGRHVGIISHVEELKERIPVQIQVNQEGNTSSSTITIIP